MPESQTPKFMKEPMFQQNEIASKNNIPQRHYGSRTQRLKTCGKASRRTSSVYSFSKYTEDPGRAARQQTTGDSPSNHSVNTVTRSRLAAAHFGNWNPLCFKSSSSNPFHFLLVKNEKLLIWAAITQISHEHLSKLTRAHPPIYLQYILLFSLRMSTCNETPGSCALTISHLSLQSRSAALFRRPLLLGLP